MNINEIIQKYLSFDQKYIKGNKDNPIKSEELFYQILKAWLYINKNSDARTGNSPSKNGFVNNFWIVLGSRTYYLNSDTERNGVLEFFRNRENSWKRIANRDGKKNLITNKTSEEAIKGFYFYKVI